LVDMLILAFGKPDRGDVHVGEALFEFGFLIGITRAGEDGVVMRERIGADVLGDLGERLDRAVVAQAALEKQEAEAGVEPFQEFRHAAAAGEAASCVSNSSTKAISCSTFATIRRCSARGLMKFLLPMTAERALVGPMSGLGGHSNGFAVPLFITRSAPCSR